MKKLILVDDYTKTEPINTDDFFEALMMTEVEFVDENEKKIYPADWYVKAKFYNLDFHEDLSSNKITGEYYIYNERGYYWVYNDEELKEKFDGKKMLNQFLLFLKKVIIKGNSFDNVIEFPKK